MNDVGKNVGCMREGVMDDFEDFLEAVVKPLNADSLRRWLLYVNVSVVRLAGGPL